MPISRADIDRLVALSGADEGFFFLAMHSLMERTLRESYPELIIVENGITKFPFNKAIYKLNEDLWNKFHDNRNIQPSERDLLKRLNDIKLSHEKTHPVRHCYATIKKNLLPMHIQCFVTFSQAMGWDKRLTLGIGRLKSIDWDKKEHDYDLLQENIKKIDELISENENLREQANIYIEENEELQSKNEKLQNAAVNAKDYENKLNAANSDNKKIREYLDFIRTVTLYTRTRHDYEQTIITPSQEQRDILDKVTLEEDYLVRGSAGTGKSLVLLKTLEKGIADGKINKESFNFRLLAYNKTLTKYNKYITSLLGINIPEKSVTTVDSMLNTLLKQAYPDNYIIYTFEKCPETLFVDENFDRKSIFNEADKFIWANNVSKIEYLDEKIPITGMVVPQQLTWRKNMWEAIEKCESELEKQKGWPRLFAAKKLNEFVEQNPQKAKELGFFTSYSFVDEVQDLPPVIISLIKKTTEKSVFLAGDSDQSIYLKGLKSAELSLSRKTLFRLKKNFRNSKQIHELAEKFRNTIPGREKESYPTADNMGLSVSHYQVNGLGDAYSKIMTDLRFNLKALETAPENICILCPKKQPLEKLAERIKKELNQKTSFIYDSDKFDFSSSEGIKLCTMQSSKGLEFPIVLLLLPDGKLLYNDDNSIIKLDDTATDEQEHNLLYVAITRAMEMLSIYIVENDKQVQAIIDLKNCLK